MHAGTINRTNPDNMCPSPPVTPWSSSHPILCRYPNISKPTEIRLHLSAPATFSLAPSPTTLRTERWTTRSYRFAPAKAPSFVYSDLNVLFSISVKSWVGGRYHLLRRAQGSSVLCSWIGCTGQSKVTISLLCMLHRRVFLLFCCFVVLFCFVFFLHKWDTGIRNTFARLEIAVPGRWIEGCWVDRWLAGRTMQLTILCSGERRIASLHGSVICTRQLGFLLCSARQAAW